MYSSQESMTSESVWSRCCDILSGELTNQQFNTWIKPLRAVDERERIGGETVSTDLVLIAPNRFIKDWVNNKYKTQIETIVRHRVNPAVTGICLTLNERPPTAYSLSSENSQTVGADRLPIKQLGTASVGVDPLGESMSYGPGERTFAGAPAVNLQVEADITPSLSFGPEDSLNGMLTHEGGGQRFPSFGEDNRYDKVLMNRNADKVGQSAPPHAHQHNILKRYRFDNFVEGKSNQLARAAAIQVVENPSGSYNPLFLYGGVGLGKTHLMHAVGNEIKRRNPGARVVYLHSERFVGDMVKALQLNAINDFKRYYRSVDALLIDDIQFFANKERSQEEFFHTFNALLEGGQQMIFSCDRYPKSITGVEERLKSRFGWGLTVHIEAPELETRVAILNRKAEQEGITIPEESAFFLASKVRANVRELEGALKRVNANAEFLKAPITVDLIKDSLKDLLALQDKMVTIDNIQRTAADYFKIKIADLHSKRRNRSVARPRQVAMALAKELTQHSLPEIGDAFGGRDHTTVIHACKKVKELRETNADVSEDYHNLIRQLST